MSESPQNDPLLSAFLDGELDQEQRESVEKRIASNPGLRTLLQSWEQQGNAIHGLPKHQLKQDLSQAVLDEIKRRRLVGELGHQPATLAPSRLDEYPPNLARNVSRNVWRRRLIGITSLAGMALLGFFLLRPDPRPQQVSHNSERVDQPLAEQDKNSNSLAASPPLNDVDSARINTDERREIASSPAMEESDQPAPWIDPSRMRAREESPEIDSDVVMVAPDGERIANFDSTDKETSQKSHPPEIALMRIRPNSDAGDGQREAGRSDSPSIDGGRFEQRPNSQTVSIPQVFFVEFTANVQPLAVVSEVFSRNEIEIQTPEGVETSSQASPDAMMKTLAAQSSHGLEAIFVVATRSQLSRAMAELSDSANISGFEVSSSILEKMLAPPPNQNERKASEPSMIDIIAQSQSNSSSQLFKEKLKKKESQETKQNENTFAPPFPQRAMAQQLQPFERKHRQPGSGVSKGQPSDSLEQIIQSDQMVVNWNYNYSRPADGESARLSSSDETGQKSAPKFEVDSELSGRQEKMVQFLLLIRTKSP